MEQIKTRSPLQKHMETNIYLLVFII